MNGIKNERIESKAPQRLTKQITVFSGVLVKDDQVLMLQRFEEECPEAHLKWEFPGGKVDFGETPEESLKREFLEETGIEVKVNQLLPKVWTNYWEYDWGTQQTLCFIFLCSYISETKRKKDHHVNDMKWFTFDDAKQLNSLPGTVEILNTTEKFLKKTIE